MTSATEEYAVIHVTLKTPLAIGKTGARPVLDSLLLQRLMLLHDADMGQARASMPLARLDDIWACGGGYDPWLGRFVQRRPIFRKFMTPALMDIAEAHNGVTRDRFPYRLTTLLGSYQSATSNQYMVSDAMRVDFRMLGDPAAVVRLLTVEPYLGPGQSCGFGEIAQVAMEPAGPHDRTWLLTDPGQRLTRPIPEALASHIDTALAWQDQVRVEAPYWKGNFRPGWRPRNVDVSG